jgi:hypothetical protein
VLILNEVTFHFLLIAPQVFDHLYDFNPTNNRISTGDGGNYVAGHVFDLIEGLLVDVEAEHAHIGSTGNEMDDIVIVFLKQHATLLLLLLHQPFE